MAIRAGASALGLVSEMPSGPGVIEEGLIAEIAAQMPREVQTFLLTSSQDPDEIVRQQQRARVTTLQLCDRLPVTAYARLRDRLPETRLVQVIHVIDETSLAEAVAAAPHVDALLLDSGRPHLAVKELGGTGRQHDWEISRRIREAVDRPVYLAGGLTPANVAEAVRKVGPFGLDLCTGVRTDGHLDPMKLAAFFAAVRAAA